MGELEVNLSSASGINQVFLKDIYLCLVHSRSEEKVHVSYILYILQ